MRADAAANRLKILEATDSLVDRYGADELRIDQVARLAGVGKATVIRRFGDKASLIAALLGEDERRLQERVIRGEPPLGPGAPPVDRADAFLGALARLYLRRLDLVYASETSSPGARYRAGAYAAWRQHLVLLVRQARPDVDAELVAHLLLAPLAAESLREVKRMRRRGAFIEELGRLARTMLA